MPYVEVRKDGKLVTQRALGPAGSDRGYVVRIGKNLKARVRVGQSARIGEYDVAVHAGHLDRRAEPVAGGKGAEAATVPDEGPPASAERFPSVEGYEVTGRLGEGGMGVVWRARQLGTNRQVALKFLGTGRFASQKSRMRFEREVELAARLQHPNIAGVFDSGVHHGVYYYAMELTEGLHLDKYVEDSGLSQAEVLALMAVVCRAVQHAHQRGVIHRDLKPSNIIVTPDGQPHVLDFGLARTFLEEDKGQTISIEGEVTGTPAYMAPEQAAGRHDQMDTRTDVYTLGVILYRLVTGGQWPHDITGSQYDLIRRIVEQEVRRPREASRTVDRELEAVLLKTLAREPEGRYASAGDLADDIDNYLSGEPLAARAPTTLYFLRKRVRKYHLHVSIAAAVILALIGMAVFAYVRVADERTRAVAAEAEASQQRDTARGETARARQAEANANDARRKETIQRKAAVKARKETERETYFLTIGLVEQKINELSFDQAADLLAGCPEALRNWEWGRLEHLCHLERITLRGHGSVYAVAYSPDGRSLASASQAVKIWDTTSGREVITLKGHEGSVSGVAFSPDGKHIASWSKDGTVRILDATSGRHAMTLKGRAGGVVAAAFSPDGKQIASGNADGTVKIWDATSGRQVMTIKGHAMYVRSVAFSPDGNRLVSGSPDKSVRIWDVPSGREVMTLEGNTGPVQSVAFSPDGKHVASASMAKTVKIWDATSGREIIKLEGHTSIVSAVTFSPDGKHIASGSRDKTVKIWDATSGRQVMTIKGHTDTVTSVAFSPDGKHVASGSMDKTVKIWDATSTRETVAFKGNAGYGRSVAFSPDGKHIATVSPDKTVKIWDATSGREAMTLDAYTNVVHSVAFSPDGRHLVSGHYGCVVIWDVSGGRKVMTLDGHTLAGTRVAFSPDGKHIAAEGVTGTVDIREVTNGRRTMTFKGHSDIILYLMFSSDGRWLASCSRDRTVKVWEASSGREAMTLPWPPILAPSVTFSPDGKHIAAMSSGGTVKVWDPATGRQAMILEDRADGLVSVAYSPDGRWLAAAGRNRTLKIWEAATGRKAVTLKAGGNIVHSVAFSPDGRHIATGTHDNAVTIWDATSRRKAITLRGHADNVSAVAFSPDGSRLVSASSDKSVKIWDVATGRELMTLKAHGDARSVAFSPDGKRIIFCNRDHGIEIWNALDWTKSPEQLDKEQLERYQRRFGQQALTARSRPATTSTVAVEQTDGPAALRFSRQDQSLSVPHADALNITGPITVEAWVKPDAEVATKGLSFLVSKNANRTAYCLLAKAMPRQSGLWYDFETSTGPGGPSIVHLAGWMHVAEVWGDGRIRVYVNGKLTSSRPAKAPVANTQPLRIGSSPFGGQTNWRGSIDEVRIWSVARTPEQIVKDMKRKLTGKEKGLAAYWTFDEGSGQVISDRTGNVPPGRFSASAAPEWAPGVKLDQ